MGQTLCSVNIGRFTATLKDSYYRSLDLVSGPVCVGGHGSNGDAGQLAGGAVPSLSPILEAIADEGFVTIMPTVTMLWGNGTQETRFDAGVSWARTNLGADSSKIVLVGASMGANSGLSYAANNPGDVRCVIGLIPAIDIQQIRVTNPLGLSLRTQIDAAWGVTYPAALPANANPYDRHAVLSAVPIQLWVAQDDPISVNYATFAANTKADLRLVGNLGHSDAAIAAASIPSILDFIESTSRI